MAGGRRINVTVEADTDGDFGKAARGLDGVAKEADGADGSLRRMSKGVQALDAEIDKTAYSVKSLRDEFSRTGDLDLLGDIGKQERTLKKLRGSLADFTRDVKDDTKKSGGLLDFALDEALVNGFKKASTKIDGVLSSIGDSVAKNPFISSALIGGVIAVSPIVIGLVSAAVGAGVAAGFAGGGIALGISRAVNDSRVQSAWTGLFDDIGRDLDSSSGRFVDPLVRGAGKVEAAWKQIFPNIDSAMNALAPTLDHLFDGVQGFIANLGPGLESISNIGAVLLQDFADFLPELGQHMTEFFQSIERAGPGVRAFFNDFLDFVLGAIDAVGWLVEKGSKLYSVLIGIAQVLVGDVKGGMDTLIHAGDEGTASIGGFHNTAIKTSDVLGLLDGSLKKTADGTIVAAKAAETLEGQLAAVGARSVTFGDVFGAAVNKVLSTTLNLDQATVGFAASSLQLQDNLEKTHKHMDIFTEKGNAQRQAILGVVSANIQEFNSLIAAGEGADRATDAYNANTRSLEAQLTNMGYTQAEIDKLIGKYRNVPADVRTQINLSGLTDAINGLSDLIRLANGIPASKTFYINEVHRRIFEDTVGHFGPNGVGGPPSQRHGGIMAAAHGMITDSPTVLFGERGTKKETYVPWAGISSQRAYELMAPTAANFGMHVVDPRRGGRSGYSSPVGVGGGGGGRSYAITVSVPLGGQAADVGAEIVESIKSYEQLNGSNWRN